MTTGRVRAAAKWCGTVAAWSVIFAALVVLTIAVLVPRVTGSTPYAVLSGSMRPGLEPGDLIVVRPTDAADIGIGSVITYQLESGEPTVATHRVVSMTYLDGEPIFRTKGDANDGVDEGWVLPVQIKGEVWYHVPYLGHGHSWLSGGPKPLLVNAVAGCLIAYAVYMFYGAWRDRRHRSDASEAPDSETSGLEASDSEASDSDTPSAGAPVDDAESVEVLQ